MQVVNKSPYSDYLRNEQDELAVRYLSAVKAIAFKLKDRLPSSIDVNDLVSIGAEELVKLARRYDSSINDSFWGYAKTRVNGAMLDYLRSLDVVSRSSRKLIKSIDLEISKYYNEYEEEPSNEYLADVLGHSVEKIKQARIASDIYSVMPLNDQYGLFEDGDALKEYEYKELMQFIKEILSTFSKREQLVIQLYYLEDMSLSEISEILSITQSRISQISKEAIRKIRAGLKDFHG